MDQVSEPPGARRAPHEGPHAAEPLLDSKLGVPAPSEGLVPRTRLLDLVRRGVRGPLTLVSAPAGSGKTALVSGWVSLGEPAGPVSWQTLDEGDEQPGVFWSYTIEALRRVGIDLGDVSAPTRGDSVDRSLLTRLAWCLEHLSEPVVMVVDTADRVPDFRRRIDLAYLMRNAGTNLRVVLLTRSDPSLPLHRYRLEGGLTEIRAADLAFTTSEARRLFAASGLDLTGEQTTALVERTGGWAAGLKFASLGLERKGDVDGSINAFTGSAGAVSGYLVREVLDLEPDDARDVLLRTSVTADVRPGLAEALTGRADARHIVAGLAARNSFVLALPDREGTFRYQPLFHQFLRAQLAYEEPSLVPRLHLTAAQWLARHGETSTAIQHAVAAEAWGEAAAFLVGDLRIGSVLTGDDTVAGRLVELPPEVEGAAASIVRAALAIRNDDTSRGLDELDRARAALKAGGASPQCELSISLLEAHCHAMPPDVDARLRAVQRADDVLHTQLPGVAASRPDIVVLLDLARARLHLRNGELDTATALLLDTADAVEVTRCEPLRSTCLGLLALAEALSGRLGDAARHVQDSDLALRDEAGETGSVRASTPVAGLLAHAWIDTERLHLKSAQGWVTEAARTGSGHDGVTRGVLALVRARILRAQGEAHSASRVLAAAHRERPEGAVPVWLAGWLAAAEASVAIVEGQPDRAMALLEGSGVPVGAEAAAIRQLAHVVSRRHGPLAPTRAAGGPGSLPDEPDGGSVALDTEVTAALVEAARLESRGDQRAAAAALERALALAEPELLRRPFAEMAPTVRRIIRVSPAIAARNGWLDAKRDLGADRHRAPAVGAVSAPGVVDGLACGEELVEPLTAKELEVLGHLAELLGTEEIASTMFISTNTVRTHVRNVLRKLGCTRRNDAVRRAWELGLLRAAAET